MKCLRCVTKQFQDGGNVYETPDALSVFNGEALCQDHLAEALELVVRKFLAANERR